VNKTELIDLIAQQADISKAAAARAGGHDRRCAVHPEEGRQRVDRRFRHLCRDQARRAHGRNPRTGATIKIKAAKVPKFRPGKGLKDALN
jgi:DNA-binding protein HU-beta